MGSEKRFLSVAANEGNGKYQQMVTRETPLYSVGNDLRTAFGRDYTRILHSTAYRRLKHKTQVFFSPQNDHICTRIEHVNHVESISFTIADNLGLNTELTKAISVGHDLGHAPFGHQGEKVLSEIAERELDFKFWHEQNGLFFVDNIELLEDYDRNKQNLNLTYAVRDGIVSHCGEVDENGLMPREIAINLDEYTKPNEFAPFTWEGCVVKLADKISYVGRDIEDAISLKVLENDKLLELADIINSGKKEKLNNTVIIHKLLSDLCENSNLENGLCLSKESYLMLREITKFNYKNIYFDERLKPSHKYFSLIINEIYSTLKKAYNEVDTAEEIKKLGKFYPDLSNSFFEWISCYWDLTDRAGASLKNRVIYHMENEKEYFKAVLDYISGMTDKYAISTYGEIVSF